jgi:hypothetical protein
MTAYERFEQVSALVLSFIVGAVIVLALIQLVVRVLPLCWRWSRHLGARRIPNAVRHNHDSAATKPTSATSVASTHALAVNEEKEMVISTAISVATPSGIGAA